MLVLWGSSVPAFAVGPEILLKRVRDNLLVDLQKAQTSIEALEPLLADMDSSQFEQYAILKASYLGMVGRQRERVALVRKSLPKVQSVDQQVKLLYELSDAYTRLGENEEALKAMNRGIRLLSKLTDNNAKVSILQGAIVLLISMDAHDEAMDYADRIYRVGVTANDPRYICLGLADRLNIQFKNGKGDTARSAMARTLQICNDSEYRFISKILSAANAINLIDIGNFSDGVAEAEKVLQYYRQSNPQSDQVNLLEEALSRGYYQLNQLDLALAFAQRTVEQAKQSRSPFMLKKANLTLARIKKAQGNLTEALEHYEGYIEQADQFEQQRMAKNLAYQRVKYDNLDKSNQLELLKVKNSSLQLGQKLQARNNANLILILSVVGVLMLFMTILLVLSFRKKQSLLYELSGEPQLTGDMLKFDGLSQLALMDARNRGVQFCVILFEVDCLVGYDSLFEQDQSNVLVAEVARICQEQLRQSDHFGRLSEHQFVICLLESSANGAAALAERCRQAIANIEVSAKLSLPLSSTFGVAMIDDNLVDYDEALSAGQKALQEAKERGGDQVYVHYLWEDINEL